LRAIEQFSVLAALRTMLLAVAAFAPLAARADATLPNLVSLLKSIPDSSWVKVNLNAWSDVWTPPDLLVPPYDGATKPGSILAAWSSFAWDPNRGDLILWGGGHANYAGNEVYRWRGSTQMWERGSVPSAVKQIAPYTYEAIDGALHAPTSSHTYDNQLFLPRLDRFITFGGAAFDTGTAMQRMLADGTVRTTGPFLWDPSKADPNKVGGTTGSQVLTTPHPEITGGNMWQNLDLWDGHVPLSNLPSSFVNGVSDYTLENGVDTVYIAGRYGGGVDQNLYRFRIPSLTDRSQDAWDVVGIGWYGVSNKGGGAYDPLRRAFIRMGSTNWLSYWDLATPGPGNKDVVVTLPSVGESFTEDYGMDRDPGTGDLVYWGGGGTVWNVRPPTPIGPNGWTVVKQPNPVGAVPSTNLGTGVLGKWKYIRNLDAFMALEVTGDVWLYRPVGWSDPGGNQAPLVAMSAPVDGSVFTAPASLTLTATASDPDGSVAKVQFYAGGTLVGTATSAPWSVAWSNVAAGTYSLYAIATDNAGATRTSSPVGVTVTAPTSGVNVAAAAAGGVATASSSYPGYAPSGAIDGDRKGVNWANNGGWNDANGNAWPDWLQVNFAGTRTIGEIDVFTLQDNYTSPAPPTLSMTFANYGITDFQVQYWTGSAWATVPGGAVTGNRNVWRQFQFAPISTDRIRVLVANSLNMYSRITEVEAWAAAGGGNVPPTVSLTSPANGATAPAPATFTLAATASDSDGTVARVDFYFNGALIGTDTSAPYTLTWPNVVAGSYSLTAVATDNAGASTVSQPVTVTVTNPTNALPTVSLTSPANGATAPAPATFTVAATASDSDGSVARVDFYASGALIGTDTSAPFGMTWSSVGEGTYSLTAVVTDNLGATTTSAPVSVTVTTGSTTSVNVAAAVNGGVASASSSYPNYAPNGAIDGDRKGLNWGNNGGWNDATGYAWPDWLQVNFAGTKTIGEIDVFTLQDNYSPPAVPTLSMTFVDDGITDFQVQYWTGAAWADVIGGVVTGNRNVWRQFKFPSVTTDRIRILVNGSLNTYSRIVEVEAWTAVSTGNLPPSVSLTSPTNGATATEPASFSVSANASDSDGSVARVDFYANNVLIGSDTSPPYSITWNNVTAGGYSLVAVATDNVGAMTASSVVNMTVAEGAGVNVAAAAKGGVASASSSYPGYSPSGAIDGDRKGLNWGNNGGWNDATGEAWPDWLQVTFSGMKTIGEIDVFTLQDNYTPPAVPTLSMTFADDGITDFQVQYWTGSAWATVPGGAVTGNRNVWRQFQFAPISTDRIRVLVANSLNMYSRITEVEAWTP